MRRGDIPGIAARSPSPVLLRHRAKSRASRIYGVDAEGHSCALVLATPGSPLRSRCPHAFLLTGTDFGVARWSDVRTEFAEGAK